MNLNRNIPAFFASTLLVCALAALPAQAADGRIPVSAPMIITQPGHYYLTRDLTTANAGENCQICIRSSGVTVDLGGHRIVAATGNQVGVGIVTGAWGTPENIEVSNGRISGFYNGINLYVTAIGRNYSFHRLSFTENVRAIEVNGTSFSYNVRVKDNLIGLTGPNSTNGFGIQCNQCISGEISGNIINGDRDDFGLNFTDSQGLLIRQNQVMNTLIALDGKYLGCSIINNTFTNNDYGARVFPGGEHNRVIGNTISHEAPPAGAYCLQVQSVNNVIEDNLLAKCGATGLSISGAGNVYSRNRSLGNSTNYSIGVGNIDGGGNL